MRTRNFAAATIGTVLLSIIALDHGLAASTPAHDRVQPVSAQAVMATHTGFVPNRGQWPDANVKFVLRDRGMNVQFTDRGFVLWNGETTTMTQDGRAVTVPVAPRWTLVGAKPVAPVAGETLAHTISYFRGDDPSRWHANVPAYRDLRYPEVLEGTELRVESRAHGFEYSFHVQPHARPDLRFRYDGIVSLEESPSGDLIVRTATGHFTESRPVSFQWINGVKCDVASSFEIVSANEYRIAVGAHDPRHELIIDPVLDWSTSVGGSFNEHLTVVKVDPAGDVVTAGISWSVDLPTTPGFDPIGTAAGQNFGNSPQFPEHSDVYIAKLSADGSQLRWAGYLGGGGPTSDSIGRNKSLTIDEAGDIFVTTHTRSPDFPVLPVGSSVHQGQADASITKIKGDGSAILWSRLLGAAEEDYGFAVALQGSDLYVSGITTSPDFPVGSPLTFGSFAGVQDAFVVRMDAASGSVNWSSFLGGSNEERVAGIEADDTGVIIFGITDSADFHAAALAAQAIVHDNTLGGANDAFLTRLGSDGAILWSTYLGGSQLEAPVFAPPDPFPLPFAFTDLAMDSLGNLVVVGMTTSADFPNTAGRFQPALAGSSDAFVAKLTSGGSLLWASYLGGGAEETASSVAINSWDEILIGGWVTSTSPSFPTTPDALKSVTKSEAFLDGFLTKIDKDGTQIRYSTLIGNTGWDDAILGLDYRFGKVVAGGWHLDTFFQITAGTFRRECNNCGSETFLMSFLDAFLAHDGFESGNYSGGEGDWAGNWSASGDATILNSSGPHSGTRHVRLRSGTGYLQRTVNVPPGSTTLSLGFWARVNSFEGNDRADVLVRSTGASFTTVASFTPAHSDDTYHYYELDLTPFLPASQIHIAFDAAMNANNDNFYLDDIRLTGTAGSVPPIADAGPDQVVTDGDGDGFATVTLNGSASSDPDGGGIVTYEWKEGTTVLGSQASLMVDLPPGVHVITLTVTDEEDETSTDTVEITVNPFVPSLVVFSDSFEVSEWNGLWTEDSQNRWGLSTQRATQGIRSAQLNGSANNVALTSIPIDLHGRTSATITFDWYIEGSLDNGEHLEFRVSTNGGATWTQKAILRGNQDPEDSWRTVTVQLTGISQLRLQFRGKMNGSDEHANLDNVKVVAE